MSEGKTTKRYEWVRSGMACVNADEKPIPWCARDYFVLASDYDSLSAELAALNLQLEAALSEGAAARRTSQFHKDNHLSAEAELAALRGENERLRAHNDSLARVLGSIIAIIPPDFVSPDGTVMEFVPPDPQLYLRTLANSISKAFALSRAK